MDFLGKKVPDTFNSPMYGGTEEFWDKSWEMPDVELVK